MYPKSREKYKSKTFGCLNVESNKGVGISNNFETRSEGTYFLSRT